MATAPPRTKPIIHGCGLSKIIRLAFVGLRDHVSFFGLRDGRRETYLSFLSKAIHCPSIYQNRFIGTQQINQEQMGYPIALNLGPSPEVEFYLRGKHSFRAGPGINIPPFRSRSEFSLREKL